MGLQLGMPTVHRITRITDCKYGCRLPYRRPFGIVTPVPGNGWWSTVYGRTLTAVYGRIRPIRVSTLPVGLKLCTLFRGATYRCGERVPAGFVVA
jgi:hypothetical protein